LSESSKHAELIQVIIRYIKREHGHLTALGILDDTARPLHAEKPSRIAGYVPDVFAFDAPMTVVIVGEAKTANDLESEHSLNQIRAYMSYLGQQHSGIFILAVPWQATRRAHTIVESLRSRTGAQSISAIILDDLGW
jgi:hypothetical protein